MIPKTEPWKRLRIGPCLTTLLLAWAGHAHAEEPAPAPAATPTPTSTPTPTPTPTPTSTPTNEPPPGDAHSEEAKESRLPLSYTERPLTLPRFVLNPLAEFNVSKEDGAIVNLALGVAFGVTDDFQIDAVVAPLELAPSLTYAQAEQLGPEVGLMYRLAKGGFEAAVRFDATAITLPSASGAVLRPGLLFRGHIAKLVRIDFGGYVPVTSGKTTKAGVQLPVALAVDLVEPLHVGVSSGIFLQSVDAPRTGTIPLGFFAGYAIGGKDGPILDIDPFLRFPKAVSTDQSTWSAVQVGVELGGFFYM